MATVIPAILTDSKKECAEHLSRISDFSPWVQIDIMDGVFVPNTSIPLDDLFEIDTKHLSLEIHLMVQDPLALFPVCERLGVKRVIAHIEAQADEEALFTSMDAYSFQKGVALNPETPLDRVSKAMHLFDEVLFLGVSPGFQGQQFQADVFSKVRSFFQSRPSAKAGVDGGVDTENIASLAELGVEYINVGSALLESSDPKATFALLQERCRLSEKHVQ